MDRWTGELAVKMSREDDGLLHQTVTWVVVRHFGYLRAARISGLSNTGNGLWRRSRRVIRDGCSYSENRHGYNEITTLCIGR